MRILFCFQIKQDTCMGFLFMRDTCMRILFMSRICCRLVIFWTSSSGSCCISSMKLLRYSYRPRIICLYASPASLTAPCIQGLGFRVWGFGFICLYASLNSLTAPCMNAIHPSRLTHARSFMIKECVHDMVCTWQRTYACMLCLVGLPAWTAAPTPRSHHSPTSSFLALHL